MPPSSREGGGDGGDGGCDCECGSSTGGLSGAGSP